MCVYINIYICIDIYVCIDVRYKCHTKLQNPVRCKRLEEHVPYYSLATSRQTHMTLGVIQLHKCLELPK